ncbi:MAG: hypothetical protein IKH19_00950 [Muribaculaceae bacterium]|nr:hypothetical protein [Muribaculaceae bacterium]
MNFLRSFFLVLSLVLALSTGARSHYITHHNGFAAAMAGTRLANGQTLTAQGQRLVASNASTVPMHVLDSATVTASAYRFMVRLANKHNKPGHSYSATDIDHNTTFRTDATQCGLVFDRISDNDYWTVVMTCANSHLHDDVMDRRSMTVTATHMVNGKDVFSQQQTVTQGVNLYDGLNSIMVQVNEQETIVSVGDKELTTVLTIPTQHRPVPVGVGAFVGPAGKTEIERMVTAFTVDHHVDVDTPWTIEALDSHFADSDDPLEGYWRYLDRDMEDRWLRLGGRYTLALVATSDGYDIIYVDGAQTKRQQWVAGKLKGHLRKTSFVDNYDATWIDATMLPIDKDVYASFDNGTILTLHFPVYKSQLRFAKKDF